MAYNWMSLMSESRIDSEKSMVDPNFKVTIAPTVTAGNITGQGSASGTSGTVNPNLGLADITKAQEGADLLKSRYIDNDPYAKYLSGARTGTMAMLGRQAQIDRTQLEAGLQRMGQGVNALRKTGARANLNTEIAYRYMGAEKGLAELGMASAERAQGAINDYIGAYLNIAGRQQGAYQSYWQRYSQNSGGVIKSGGKSTRDPNETADEKSIRAAGFGKGMGGIADLNAGVPRGLGLDTAKAIGSTSNYAQAGAIQRGDQNYTGDTIQYK